MPPPGGPGYPGGMSPQEFIQQIAEAVARKIAQGPPKLFDVKRVDPDGKARTEQVTLPQAMADLSDQLKIKNELSKIEIETMIGLRDELEQNRKIGRQMLKSNRKKAAADDDEDDE